MNQKHLKIRLTLLQSMYRFAAVFSMTSRQA